MLLYPQFKFTNINYYIGKLLPNKIKRLVFISSLAATIYDINNDDIETLHKLNLILNLCNDDGAMLLPVALGNIIWNHKNNLIVLDINNNDHNLTIKTTISDIINIMPKWLVYSDFDSIKKDVEKLLSIKDILQYC